MVVKYSNLERADLQERWSELEASQKSLQEALSSSLETQKLLFLEKQVHLRYNSSPTKDLSWPCRIRFNLFRINLSQF